MRSCSVTRQELCFAWLLTLRNPCCNRVWILFTSKFSLICMAYHAYQEFAANTSQGDRPVVWCNVLIPLLEDWCMFVFPQSSGSSPVSSDYWKMVVSTGANSGASSWRTRSGMVSGPEDLDGPSCWSIFSTPATCIDTTGIGRYGVPSKVGRHPGMATSRLCGTMPSAFVNQDRLHIYCLPSQ